MRSLVLIPTLALLGGTAEAVRTFSAPVPAAAPVAADAHGTADPHALPATPAAPAAPVGSAPSAYTVYPGLTPAPAPSSSGQAYNPYRKPAEYHPAYPFGQASAYNPNYQFWGHLGYVPGSPYAPYSPMYQPAPHSAAPYVQMNPYHPAFGANPYLQGYNGFTAPYAHPAFQPIWTHGQGAVPGHVGPVTPLQHPAFMHPMAYGNPWLLMPGPHHEDHTYEQNLLNAVPDEKHPTAPDALSPIEPSYLTDQAPPPMAPANAPPGPSTQINDDPTSLDGSRERLPNPDPLAHAAAAVLHGSEFHSGASLATSAAHAAPTAIDASLGTAPAHPVAAAAAPAVSNAVLAANRPSVPDNTAPRR